MLHFWARMSPLDADIKTCQVKVRLTDSGGVESNTLTGSVALTN